jgi:aminoglycoside phosphotransferase (APT) family kinase protein
MSADLDAYTEQRRALFYPKADLLWIEEAAAVPADARGRLALAADVCRTVFGEAPTDVRPLAQQGTFHLLYRAALADGRAVVVRLNAVGDRQRDYALHLDGWAAEMLRRRGLPALHVYHVDVTRSVWPVDVQILEEAPGRPLTVHDDDDQRLRPLLTDLGRFIARVHEIGLEGFGLLGIRLPASGPAAGGRPCGLWSSWRDYLRTNLAGHLRACQDMGAVSGAEVQRVEAVFAAGETMFRGVPPVLLHGDLGNHNVFADDGGVRVLIDWEDCLAGDPVFDIAFWGTFHPEPRREAFLAGYREVRSLPADFETRYWLYFLRVALAKTVLRHRLRVPDRPGRPPASRRIQLALARLEGEGQASEPAA